MTDDLPKPTRSGGVFFFFSLAALIFVATWNVRFLLGILANWGLARPLLLCVAAALGWLISKYLFRAHFATFLHELKHAVLSNLVGNKSKGMKIRRNSGHFKYEYTEETARYNAFISLAPYCFPLFTTPTLAAASWLATDRLMAVAAVGIALGADLQSGWRDVGPYQTDFSMLRGGYFVGFIYVIAATVVLSTLMITWAAGGWQGLAQLGTAYLITLRSILPF